ncbi:MAG TPA: TetR/AcrR family transcriptional regulator [Candidatus Deferrimicrobium sp.]|nr:TetR/AcrR family transcriptional regulator [Candidatus Deferrimicrobium sp.]
MVEAAYRLMSARGYIDTTIADIAAEAGVAVQTVYFTFHNKPGVLRAAFEFAVTGDHRPGGPAEREWFVALRQERDAERALVILVDATAEIFRRIVPLASVFQVLGDDPEIDSFSRLNRRLTRDGYRLVIDNLARKRPLRPGLSHDDATTILLVLLGSDVYRSMLEDHGWTEQKWRSWVIETLLEALFGHDTTG